MAPPHSPPHPHLVGLTLSLKCVKLPNSFERGNGRTAVSPERMASGLPVTLKLNSTCSFAKFSMPEMSQTSCVVPIFALRINKKHLT